MMKTQYLIVPIIVMGISFMVMAQQSSKTDGKLNVAIVKNRSQGPEVMASGGLRPMLAKLDCEILSESMVELTPDEEKQYGDWNRAALENRHLGEWVSRIEGENILVVGLLNNCVDLLGMLAGLQHSTLGGGSKPDSRSLQNQGLAGRKPLRVGLIWIDAHADFNTPETTLSGMLGGMPVAIASGLCLTRLRLKTGLDPALPTKYIVMAGLRDVDPLEQELLDRSQCEWISVQDIKERSDNLHHQMKRLSRLTDIIYVHIDMDVLDPGEVAGHPLTAPQGPTSSELAAAIEIFFQYEKAAAIGIASMPFGEKDKKGISLKAAYRLIEGAVKGVQKR
jgi:arginase family enzyme